MAIIERNVATRPAKVARAIHASSLFGLLAIAGCSSAGELAALRNENTELRGEIADRDRQIDLLQQKSAASAKTDVATTGASGVPGIEPSDDPDAEPNGLSPLQLQEQTSPQPSSTTGP